MADEFKINNNDGQVNIAKDNATINTEQTKGAITKVDKSIHIGNNNKDVSNINTGDNVKQSVEIKSTDNNSIDEIKNLISKENSDKSSNENLSRYEFIYAYSGLIVGVICILCGMALCLNGVKGEINWTTKILGQESELNDAAPGVILFILGLFFVIVTRFKIKALLVQKNKNE